MVRNLNEKVLAIRLRQQGFSYSEILTQIPVAKSTLSLWLREVGLSKRVIYKLTEKKRLGALRGAMARKNQRITTTKIILEKAEKEIDKITNRELWLIGIALYWAEGAKQKVHNVSEKVKFSNSDTLMLKVFLQWLYQACHVPPSGIRLDLYIHDSARNFLGGHIAYWERELGFQVSGAYFKRNKIKTLRKNIGENYHGLISISVKKSTDLNRKIAGWIVGIYKNCRVV